MNPALVLVDIQKDYFPKGRMEVIGAVEASQGYNKVAEPFSRKTIIRCSHPAHFNTTGRNIFLAKYGRN